MTSGGNGLGTTFLRLWAGTLHSPRVSGIADVLAHGHGIALVTVKQDLSISPLGDGAGALLTTDLRPDPPSSLLDLATTPETINRCVQRAQQGAVAQCSITLPGFDGPTARLCVVALPHGGYLATIDRAAQDGQLTYHHDLPPGDALMEQADALRDMETAMSSRPEVGTWLMALLDIRIHDDPIAHTCAPAGDHLFDTAADAARQAAAGVVGEEIVTARIGHHRLALLTTATKENDATALATASARAAVATSTPEFSVSAQVGLSVARAGWGCMDLLTDARAALDAATVTHDEHARRWRFGEDAAVETHRGGVSSDMAPQVRFEPVVDVARGVVNRVMLRLMWPGEDQSSRGVDEVLRLEAAAMKTAMTQLGAWRVAVDPSLRMMVPMAVRTPQEHSALMEYVGDGLGLPACVVVLDAGPARAAWRGALGQQARSWQQRGAHVAIRRSSSSGGFLDALESLEMNEIVLDAASSAHSDTVRARRVMRHVVALASEMGCPATMTGVRSAEEFRAAVLAGASRVSGPWVSPWVPVGEVEEACQEAISRVKAVTGERVSTTIDISERARQ